MKAIRIHSYGGPEVVVLEEIGKPAAGAGQVLVKVRAAGINPVDWKIREGYLRDFLKHEFPLTMGGEFSGTVEAAGPDVAGFAPGQAVYGFSHLIRLGAFAE